MLMPSFAKISQNVMYARFEWNSLVMMKILSSGFCRKKFAVSAASSLVLCAPNAFLLGMIL